MSRGSVISIVGAAALALAGAAAWLWLSREALPDDLLKATPRQSTALVHVRVSRLLSSKAFDQLISQRGHDAGMKEVTKLCGYNPLARVDEALLFALPAQRGGLPEWGALLRGDLDPRELAECVKRTLEQHGKKSKLEQDDLEGIPCAVSSRGDSRACAIRNGLIVGTDRSTRAAIASLREAAPNARERDDLLSMWRTLSDSADARGVAFVPDETQTLLRGLVRPFLPESLAPLTQVSAGAGELVAADSVRGHLVLDTPSASDAKAVATAVESLLQRLVDVPALALTPAAALVRATRVRSDGVHVRFEGDYPLHALGTVLDLLPTAQRLLGPARALATPPSTKDADAKDAGKAQKAKAAKAP